MPTTDTPTTQKPKSSPKKKKVPASAPDAQEAVDPGNEVLAAADQHNASLLPETPKPAPVPDPALEDEVVSFSIEPLALSRALARVKGAAVHKTTMPILGSVLIRTELPPEGPGGEDDDEEPNTGRLILTATDLELSLTATVPAVVRRAGTVCVSAKVLVEIVRALPRETVYFQQDRKNWVTVKCGRTHYRISGQSSTAFPTIPLVDADVLPIDAGALRELIDRTVYAVSEDQTRYNLCGVYLEASPIDEEGGDVTPGLRGVATDGHRLALADARWPSAPAVGAGVIVPRKGIVEIRKLLEGGDGEEDATARFGIRENCLVLERNGLRLTSQLVNGVFPDYRAVLPEPPSVIVEVDRALLLESLRRVDTIAVGKGESGVRIDLSPKSIRLSATVLDVGEFEEEIEAETTYIKGKKPPEAIGVAIRFMRDALEAIDEPRVRLRIMAALSPVALVGVDDDGKEATGVVMPMRV